ncbi:MAG: Fic family protein [Bacteroidota bacterium]
MHHRKKTPIKMKELVEKYRNSSQKKLRHPVVEAAMLHYDFVRIHPFDDSNGRTSRLLMNYVLIRNGYPPVIIKSSDKRGYLDALNKADVGLLDAFAQYIGEQLIWSLEISIKAASGDSIEEPDDTDKELDVLAKELNSKNIESPIKSIDLFRSTINGSIKAFSRELLFQVDSVNFYSCIRFD